MKTLRDLDIEQTKIALFGSGTSVNELTQEEFNFIKTQCFVITINYAPLHLKGHLNMWSDRRVSAFLSDYYKTHPKECLFLAQKQKVNNDLEKQVDFWFSRKDDRLQGNFTLVWALQLLQVHFPEKDILLFGVDMYSRSVEEVKWYDRFTDYDRKKRGRRYNIQNKLEQCAKQLERYCKKDKVFNCNPKSQFHFFTKKDWQSFLQIKILHLCNTSLAGAPSHLSKIINKYTSCDSIAVLKRDFKSAKLKNLRWDYDVKSPSPAKLKSLIQWADILHFHRKIYTTDTQGKKSLLQFHSPPNGYKPGKTHADFNGRKLVIAQYHPRFYTDAFIVPNLIDIWDDNYKPAKKPIDRIKIFYSWATEVKGGWADKGSKSTKQILSRIKRKYGNQVEIKIFNNRPYEECLAEKRTAHICIDECVTGSYHLQSLEGSSVGAVTFNNIDQTTLSYLAEVTKHSSHPFVKSNLDQLFEKLCSFIEEPSKLKLKGQMARQWMEDHWDPKKLVYRYINAYANVSLYGTIQPQPTRSSSKSVAITSEATEPTRPASPAPSINTKKVLPRIRSIARRESFSITRLYQQFEGRRIFIFGTGPSLLHIDPEEYKNEICFGINFAFEYMPYLDYHLVHVIETYEAIKDVLDNHQLILPETLVRQWYRERIKNIRPQRILTQNQKAHIYPIQNPKERNLNRKHVNLDRATQFFTWSTTTHSAIHLAAYMGATEINLVGMDYKKFPNGQVHFNSQYSPIYGQQNWDTNQKHKQGDEWLTKQLRKQGIIVKNLSHDIAKKHRDTPQRISHAVLQE